MKSQWEGKQLAAYEEGYQAGEEIALDVGPDMFNTPFGVTMDELIEDASISFSDADIDYTGRAEEAWMDGFAQATWDVADSEYNLARTDAEHATLVRIFPGVSAEDIARKGEGIDPISLRVSEQIFDTMAGMLEIAKAMQGKEQTDQQIKAMGAMSKGAAMLNELVHLLSPGMVPEIVATVVEVMLEELQDRGSYEYGLVTDFDEFKPGTDEGFGND